MTDIRLNSDGDIWWEEGLIDTVDGEAEILQSLQIELETGLGEWAFDILMGVPYQADTASRDGNEALVIGAVRGIAERILGLDSIKTIQLLRDPELQRLTINIDTVYGKVTATI